LLFHNPEDLSDSELKSLQLALRIQAYKPRIGLLLGVSGMYLLDTAVLKRSFCFKRLAVAGVLGYTFGGYLASQQGTVISRNFDIEILNAFE